MSCAALESFITRLLCLLFLVPLSLSCLSAEQILLKPSFMTLSYSLLSSLYFGISHVPRVRLSFYPPGFTLVELLPIFYLSGLLQWFGWVKSVLWVKVGPQFHPLVQFHECLIGSGSEFGDLGLLIMFLEPILKGMLWWGPLC